MRLTASCFARIALLASLSLAACSSTPTNETSTGSPTASSAGSVAGTSAGSTTGPGGSSNSGTTTGSTGGTSTGTAGTTGTTTGAPPVFVDGGYVACFLAFAVDAGPDGDGGPAYWDCPAGTYFCDPSGDIGDCFQCQSDSDCTNPNLPTFDPRKPHCDTSSGEVGAEHFCQECTTNADCVGNPKGGYCDVNPGFHEPPIETLGFETCNPLVTDCRVDGGPICGAVNQYCDPQSGHCLTRSGACQSDDDCIGYLSPYSAITPEPYCSDAGCSPCPGGVCPSGFCFSDAACANGTFCDLTSSSPTDSCKCTDSSQCSGLWPVCLDIETNDAGQTFGSCGCDDSSECGDGGLICMPPAYAGQIPQCGIPCTSPDFPACFAVTGFTPICNPQAGLCASCTSDNQCRNSNDPAGPRCDTKAQGGFGTCGCANNADCAAGETCQASGSLYGTCTPTLPRCTPESCGTDFCNWDSGSCMNGGSTTALCLTDFDCAVTSFTPATCVGGKCLQCQSNADCLNSGAAKKGGSVCCLPGVAACEGSFAQNNTCADVCLLDADCTNNGFGQSCIIQDAGLPPRCGCGSDSDCAGNSLGSHCDRNPGESFFGYCGCATNGDCQSGATCQIYGGSTGFCNASCFSLDAGECLDGYFCDPNHTCRPRCDNGNQCQGNDTLCDTLNSGGQNDAMYGITAPGVQWCYPCVSASNCPAGQGCDPSHGCNTCASSADCPSGTACIDGGICQPTCVGATCSSGDVCDVHGLVGFGANVCYQCLSAADCPNSEGCNSQSHTCGTCFGPNSMVGTASDPIDCPPDAVCSNYWTYSKNLATGVCLANCDRTPCPSTEPICAVFPGLTPDHKFCFGCLKDSDCSSSQRCNLSPDPTFTCVDKP